MTATLVLQHVARGDLGLDPVADRVPEFRLDLPEAAGGDGPPPAQPHERHRSGRRLADTGEGDDAVACHVAEGVAGAPLLHPPGERWSYCNAGFTVPGRWSVLTADRGRRPGRRHLRPRRHDAMTIARLTRGACVTGHRYDPDSARSSSRPAGCRVGRAGGQRPRHGR
jgi:hypothetical protein